jgi:hypothetical protein
MTCDVCGEKTFPGVVCCDLLMDELGDDDPAIVRGSD